MSITYTPEQAKAIAAEGKVIVSASAGSGKTFVMIEKMVNLVLSGADLNHILAVTYTNKAAAQMREKLKTAIVAAINAPDTPEERKTLLKHRLATLSQAEICTIHAFCSHLLRRFFYVLDISGDFSIVGGEAEEAQLQAEALERLFETLYEDKDEGFYRLLSVYWRKKSDNRLRKIILETYGKLRTQLDYRTLLTSERYDEESFRLVASELKRLYTAELSAYRPVLEGFSAEAEALNYPKLAPVLAALTACIAGAEEAEDVFSLPELPPQPRFPVCGKKDPPAAADLLKRVKDVRDDLKKRVETLYGLADSRETEWARYCTSRETAQALIGVILRFDEVYTALKQERSRLDYNDLEHFTLRLLQQEEVLSALREKYRYVFVDEYQDVNPVQERILSAFTGQVFLVGDTKQSIYGFRGSKSVYFNRTFAAYAKEGRALLLTSNFRSAEGILDFVNRIFSESMTTESCGIDYAGTSMMHGRGYAAGAGRVRIHFAPPGPRSAAPARGVYSVMAHYLVREEDVPPCVIAVEEIIRQELQTPREGGYYSYGDIAVLVRGMNEKTASLVSYLSEQGIPVTTSVPSNICQFGEVQQLLDLLSLIDNAEQDVPLCSALLSAVGGCNEDDLAAIRLRHPAESFRQSSALCSAEDSPLGERLRQFYAALAVLRARAQVQSAGEILVSLLSDYGMEADYLAQPNGRQKIARVQRLLAEAQGNVPEFLEYVKNTGYNIPFASAAGEDAVKILTIHASKGLEYPVVILFNGSQPFHPADRGEALFDEKYGLAVRCFDREQKVAQETLLRKLAKRREEEERVKDELNLFYVALTRAKEVLHLVFDRPTVYHRELVPYASSFADFVPFARFRDLVAEERHLAPAPPKDAIVTGRNQARKDDFLQAISYRYPYADVVDIAVKSSASALLRERKEERTELVPQLFGESSAEKGTAYHKFLQYVEFGAPLKEELARLKEKFSEDEWSLLDEGQLGRILAMPVFAELAGSTLLREQEFMVALPASAVFGGTCGDKVLIQGAIDLLGMGKNGVFLLDYKYSQKPADVLKKTYAAQLLLYRKAVSQILGVAEETIRMTIVNILRGEEIPISDKM